MWAMKKAVDTWTQKVGLFFWLPFGNVLGQCVHKNIQKYMPEK